MKTILKVTLAASLLLGVSMAFTGEADAARKQCAMLGAQGTGVLQEVAKDQALWQLEDMAKNYGGKAAGKVKTTCKTTLIVSECNVSQRYCK